MSVKDGPSCPGCGLANYEGLCPHCRGDQVAYEHELVPPFDSSRRGPEDVAQALDEVLDAIKQHQHEIESAGTVRVDPRDAEIAARKHESDQWLWSCVRRYAR